MKKYQKGLVILCVASALVIGNVTPAQASTATSRNDDITVTLTTGVASNVRSGTSTVTLRRARPGVRARVHTRRSGGTLVNSTWAQASGTTAFGTGTRIVRGPVSWAEGVTFRAHGQIQTSVGGAWVSQVTTDPVQR